MANQCYCKTCNRTMAEEQFYTSYNTEKYPPNGKLPECKKCITRHVDNFNPETFLWILQEVDVPWAPEEWQKLMVKYAKDREKLTGTTILGRYLSKMKLKQYKDYRWKDNEHLKEMAANKLKITMMQQGYDDNEIALAIDKQDYAIPSEELLPPTPPTAEDEYITQEDYFSRDIPESSSFDDELTDEDRTYLRLKWGKTYKPEEWVRLEQLYEEMMGSYDIQTAGHIDTLKLICKTSLKANQLLDLGDVDGAQKMIKMYDGLMKSGKFTAAQNKAEQGEFVDSVGELIEMCEKEGYIERYYVEQPNDKVDFTIRDMQRYTRTLIEEETNLSDMIEMALKQNAKEDEDAKANEEFDIIDDDDLVYEDLERNVVDKDFEDFNDFIDAQREEDENMFLNGDKV